MSFIFLTATDKDADASNLQTFKSVCRAIMVQVQIFTNDPALTAIKEMKMDFFVPGKTARRVEMTFDATAPAIILEFHGANFSSKTVRFIVSEEFDLFIIEFFRWVIVGWLLFCQIPQPGLPLLRTQY